MQQLSLFAPADAIPDVYLPPEIDGALKNGAALAISISGGKDSQAMLIALTRLYQPSGWTGPLFAIHAHLGRAEWPQSLGMCQKMADDAGIPLTVVARPQGDLVQEIEDRKEKLAGTGKPFWPDAKNRYCTSDQKRTQIDKVLRAPFWPDAKNRYCTSHHKTNQIDKRLRGYPVVISAEGIRAEESPARAKKSPFGVRKAITAKALEEMTPADALAQQSPGQRVGLTWYPIFYWEKPHVYERCGHTLDELGERRALYRAGDHEQALNGWQMHPAYVFGNERLSCALCILGSRNDIENGARHNPELLSIYADWERETGFTFRQDLALMDVQAGIQGESDDEFTDDYDC